MPKPILPQGDPNGVKDYSRLFEIFGVTFGQRTGSQLLADTCPFCDGPKFYLNAESGQWDCKSGSCRRSGNHLTFIRTRYGDLLEQTTDEQYHWLRDKRGSSLQTLKRHSLAFDAHQCRWLIPFKNGQGEVVNLQLYSQNGGPKLNLPGLPTYLYGFDKLSDDHKKTLYICEGPLDAIALDCHLKQNRAKYDILGIPGTFKQDWAVHFKDRKVRCLFDNDEGGDNHRKRVQKLLGESGVVRKLELLKWPDGFPTGCDINDLVRDKSLGVEQVVGWAERHSFEVTPEPKLIVHHGRRDTTADRPIEWVWEHRLRCGTYVSFSGRQGTFKSTIARELAARYSTGRPMPKHNRPTMPAGHVLYLYAEDDRDAVENGFEWAGGDFANWSCMPAVAKDGDALNVLDHLPEMEQLIRERGTRLVIIDGQNSVVGAPNISTDMQARVNITNKLHQFAQRLNVCLIGIRNEDADGRAYGPASMADIGRGVMRTVELPCIKPKAGEPPYCQLVFVKVNDAARELYPPIPYSVKNLGGARREILWGKTRLMQNGATPSKKL